MSTSNLRVTSGTENVSRAQNKSSKRPGQDSDEQSSNDNLTARKRITRACDQCNRMRSKCDGVQPCSHCVENDLVCAFERAHKKRGRVPRVSRKDQQQAGSATSPGQHYNIDTHSKQNEQVRGNSSTMTSSNSVENVFHMDIMHNNDPLTGWASSLIPNERQQSQPASRMVLGQATRGNHTYVQPTTTIFGASEATAYTGGNLAGNAEVSGFGFPLGDDYSVGFMGPAPMIESPDWLTFASPMLIGEQWTSQPRPPDTLRFPVLQPILPYLESIIPTNLACDLLEQYFTAASLAGYQPKNPYVLGYIFRKQSVLHPTHPRPCTAALLASMLWISAQNSDASFLTNQPDARARTCQKLLELTIARLKPLIHNHVSPAGQSGDGIAQRNAGIGGLVLPTDIMAGKEVSREQVDNIVTYIHLAAVVSASERKAASLRWWNTAWSLARETKLGQEIADDQPLFEDHQTRILSSHQHMPRARQYANSTNRDSVGDESRLLLPPLSAEDREERRRTWWLLYLMDRHLALCYNRPAFFINKECEGLLLPMGEDQFQLGQFDCEPVGGRRNGLNVECTSFSVYGFFLPLMVILGEILDLNHARNRPQLGPGAKRRRDFSGTVIEIEEQLQAFEDSLYKLWAQYQRSEIETYAIPVADTSDLKKFVLHAKMVVSYATHIMHVLHILLTGKWDPIAMLDDNDLWISSQSFVNATSHAVQAAKALADITDYDPDLALMPYFFGIYLLQGSFLLLLFADKLQDNITADVVQACETIVRAHEACISTLDTQYQRNFRRVMRSALQQLRGRMHEDATEQQHWRREILKLYRWTGDGTGLAL